MAELLGDAWLPTEFVEPLDRYHQWLAEHRVPDDDGLLVIISPYESGMDQSPTYDEVLGIRGRAGPVGGCPSATGGWTCATPSITTTATSWCAAAGSG